MQIEDRSHSQCRTTVDDVAFAITLSILAASLVLLVASVFTEAPGSIALAAGAQQSTLQTGAC